MLSVTPIHGAGQSGRRWGARRLLRHRDRHPTSRREAAGAFSPRWASCGVPGLRCRASFRLRGARWFRRRCRELPFEGGSELSPDPGGDVVAGALIGVLAQARPPLLRRLAPVLPAPAVDRDHLLGRFLERGHALGAAPGGQRVAAGAGELAVGERQLARFGQRDEGVAAEAEPAGALRGSGPAAGPQIFASVSARGQVFRLGTTGSRPPRNRGRTRRPRRSRAGA